MVKLSNVVCHEKHNGYEDSQVKPILYFRRAMPDILFFVPLFVCFRATSSSPSVLYMAEGTPVAHCPSDLVDEIDAEEMQDQAAHNVVGERPAEALQLARCSLVGGRGCFHTSRGKPWGTRSCSLPWSGYGGRLDLVSNCRYPHRWHHVLVRTNCPTVPQKPDRKALKGYRQRQFPIIHTLSLVLGTHIVAGKDTVEELQGADDGEKGEKHVEELRPLGGLVHVVIVNVAQDLVPVGRTDGGLGLGWGRDGASCRGASRDGRGGGGRGLAGVLLGRHVGLRFVPDVEWMVVVSMVWQGWSFRVPIPESSKVACV